MFKRVVRFFVRVPTRRVDVKVTRHKRLDFLIRWYTYNDVNLDSERATKFFCCMLSEDPWEGSNLDCDVIALIKKDLSVEETIKSLEALKQKYTDK